MTGFSCALLLLGACGAAAKPAPAPPPPAPDPTALAAEIHAELVAMADATHTTRGDCPRMAVTLRPVIIRMRASTTRAEAMQADATLGPRLVAAVHAYDHDATMTDAIVSDLATCRDDPGVPALIDAMPTL